MPDFFVSYNRQDRVWTEWIAWTLEERGYAVLQGWDFRPGSNFVLEMQKAASSRRQTIMVLSPAYLAAEYTQAEWAAAFGADPRGMACKLIPVRVAPCEPAGLLGRPRRGSPLLYDRRLPAWGGDKGEAAVDASLARHLPLRRRGFGGPAAPASWRY